MNCQLLCKTCHTPARTTKTLAYMRCMCDEDVRIVPLFQEGDIKVPFVSDILYLLETEGTNYVKLESSKTF
jgi:hypothetical protein